MRMHELPSGEKIVMSQSPPNLPPQPGEGNPFADRNELPLGPAGGQYNPYAPTGPQPQIGDDPAMRWVLPVGTSGWAIAAGYLGLFSAICLPAPLAVICSLVAIWHLRKNPRLSGWGRAIFGLVMGLIGMIGFVAMLIGIVSSQ
jgi:hypothetical protein